MTPITLRDEYFAENGQLVRRTGRRPSGRGRWKNERHPDLAVAVEMNDDGIYRVYRGDQHTRDREREAVARSYNLSLNEAAPDVGRRVPAGVIEEFRKRIDSLTQKVSSRYRNLSNEERMTGALFGQLPDILQIDQWIIRFHSQGYTSVQKKAKEKQIGADAGVVVEVRDGSEVVTKALWLQAKRVAVLPPQDKMLNLHDLRDQMKTMDAFTEDGYAMIYTPSTIVVTDGMKQWTFGEWLAGAIKCERGDRSPTVIVNTLDRNYLLEVGISTASP